MSVEYVGKIVHLRNLHREENSSWIPAHWIYRSFKYRLQINLGQKKKKKKKKNALDKRMPIELELYVYHF